VTAKEEVASVRAPVQEGSVQAQTYQEGPPDQQVREGQQVP